MKNEKKFIRIESKMNITVTTELKHMDVSEPDAHVPDRLRIAPQWQNTTVDIKQGTGYYPAYIKNWNSVQVLSKANVLTLGEEVDECEGQQQVEEIIKDLDRNLEKVKDKSNGFISEKEEREAKVKKVSKINLADIAGE